MATNVRRNAQKAVAAVFATLPWIRQTMPIPTDAVAGLACVIVRYGVRRKQLQQAGEEGHTFIVPFWVLVEREPEADRTRIEALQDKEDEISDAFSENINVMGGRSKTELSQITVRGNIPWDQATYLGFDGVAQVSVNIDDVPHPYSTPLI
jgi:hypothetical protein